MTINTYRVFNRPGDDRNRTPVHLSAIMDDWGIDPGEIKLVDKAHHPNRIYLYSGDFVEVQPDQFIIID